MRRGPGAITRAWCLFEIVEALANGCKLHVVLNQKDTEGFEDLLTEQFDEVAKILAGVDARDAQISKVEDRAARLARGDGPRAAAWAEDGTGAVGLQFGLASLLQGQGKYDELEPLATAARSRAVRRRAGRRCAEGGGQSGDPVCSAGQV